MSLWTPDLHVPLQVLIQLWVIDSLAVFVPAWAAASSFHWLPDPFVPIAGSPFSVQSFCCGVGVALPTPHPGVASASDPLAPGT